MNDDDDDDDDDDYDDDDDDDDDVDVDVDVDYVYGLRLMNENHIVMMTFPHFLTIQTSKPPPADVHQFASGVSSRAAGSAGSKGRVRTGRFPLFQANLGWWNIILKYCTLARYVQNGSKLPLFDPIP